ncbi:YitT family protein [Lactobacillus iners]|uniref:YitT family protein n=1 Tax=Lactobacillus iners TaxID=147802 RepID=UPI0029C2BCDA|nr:YitT family protein [Lactobacillus iners]MCT7727295.1 YitT family protein [Lactobacillus iners]MDX5067260.1 YitT family protein [Lactobacillus iners]MDX5085160.1 YitT family protein [Lactobacillus iners]
MNFLQNNSKTNFSKSIIKSILNTKTIKDLFFIALGASIYAFSLDAINIKNQLADGGISGVTLLLRYWFKINPGISTLVLNIPLIIIGYKYMGRRMLILTIWGTSCLSFFLSFWLHTPFIHQINLDHDLFLAGLLTGLLSGLGIGIVFKFGGTTGGTDIIARILELKLGIPIGKTLLGLDVLVLGISLSYLDTKHMLYTLVGSYFLAKIADYVQEGSYAAKGVIIISDKYLNIAKMINLNLDRGYTYLLAEGGYQNDTKKIIYCVVSPRELSNLKSIVLNEDKKAFVSIIDVHETLGEGFTYLRKKNNIFQQFK